MKPAFRIPTMREIASVPANGFDVVSTFSGCGGSSLGYKLAGFRVLWASEFIPAAQDVYRINHPSTLLDTRDIRDVTGDEILRAIGRSQGDLDLLDGSPPCAAFSTNGRTSEHWGKVKRYSQTQQRVDDLFFEYTRLVRDIQPRVFLAENVAGLARGVAKGMFQQILRALKACGYLVECQRVDAQWLGVPQTRVRLFFLGVRNDLAARGVRPAFPKPLPYRYTLDEAVPWLNPARGLPVPYVDPETQLSEVFQTEWDKTAPGSVSMKCFNFKKPRLDRPCATLTAYGANGSTVIHPFEKRRFSIAEIKRIHAFPDDFVLTGNYVQQWERLGRAVPPLMMAALATTIRDEILRHERTCIDAPLARAARG